MTTRIRLAVIFIVLVFGIGITTTVNAALSWGNQGSECRGTQRVDFARLWGLSPGTDWVGICRKTSASKVSGRANGKVPSTCIQKPDGGVWGEWKFSNHASCKAQPKSVQPLTWGNVDHKCEQGARIEYGRLWGLQPGADWVGICKKTKALNISDLSDGKVPSRCEQKLDGSVWGEWKYSGHASCAAKWGDFKKDHCVSTGYRQWSSRIWEQGSDPMIECRRTPAVVNGQRFATPSRCQNLGAGGVWGEFDVADPSCPFWGNELGKAGLVRGDCSALHIRKHYARLWDIADGIDWNRACHTKPATIGPWTGAPSRCVNKGILGMWGEWYVEDIACTADKLPQDAQREAIARAKLDEIKDLIMAKAHVAEQVTRNSALMNAARSGDSARIANAVRTAESDTPSPVGVFPRTWSLGATAEGTLLFVSGSAEAGTAFDRTGTIASVYPYATAGYTWGPGLGGSGGVTVGFWECMATKIGGDGWGVVFGLDDIATLAVKKNPFNTTVMPMVGVGLWFSFPDEDDTDSVSEFRGFTFTVGASLGANFGGYSKVATAIDGDETIECDGTPKD
ncbi:MAG: hypothetical protein KDI27_10270 [Gammaproteobacteria bacterium]|nr:hypothetical protein [Gammaproteobacteria bacterium]MCB1852699.1 hypothetical protein [Gammaproteobacteria bacterium]